MNSLQNVIRNWLYVDTRTLAFFRISFGFMGLFDVLRRYGFIDVFYSNAGMDFKRHVTNKYAIKYFSLLDHIHSSTGVHLFFIITAICFVLFIIGYRTRFFQLLAVMGLISIHNAAVILENGADLVYNNYLIWALFLPLGTSWSFDSIRKSLQSNEEYDCKDLNKPTIITNKKIFHMGYVACLVQLAMIYFYNHVNKTGSMWHDGTAVHYMYQLDTFITFTGEWMRSVFSIEIFKILTLLTKYIEMLAPIAILSPIFQPWLRRGTFIIFIIFHFIIALSINIGMFSWVMMSVLILLLGSQEMDLLKKMFSRFKRRKYVVFYDRDCGFCHLSARILKRMDAYSRFTWADRLTKGEKPNDLDALLEKSIVVWDKGADEIWIRHEGFHKLVSALPLGFMVAWVLRVPLLGKVFGFVYDLIAQNRTSISKSMGLPACGLSIDDPPKKIHADNKNIYASFGKKTIWLVSNLLAFALLIGTVDYSMRINKGLIDTSIKDKEKAKATLQAKKFKKIRRTMKHVLLYPRMYQEWNMFSPKVLMNETWLLADVFFENGEKLTLFKTSDDIENRFDRKYFQPYAMQFWRKFFERIGKKNYMRHLPKFKNWLKDTDHFAYEYDGRKVKEVRLWRLSERSLVPGKDMSASRGVFKRELKQRDKNKLKNKDLLKKRKGKKLIKK